MPFGSPIVGLVLFSFFLVQVCILGLVGAQEEVVLDDFLIPFFLFVFANKKTIAWYQADSNLSNIDFLEVRLSEIRAMSPNSEQIE